MPESMTPLVAVGVIGALFVLLLSLLTNNYSLNNIKSKTVGDGQYGTARWATDQEIRKAYVTVPFDVASWRAGKKRPTVQGLVLGSVQRGKRLNALVDCADHETMHIVAIHQRLQSFAALHTAENQSLHSWSLLPSAPRCNIKGYRDVSFSDLLIRRPACCAILTVANGFGFDIVQRVIVRKK